MSNIASNNCSANHQKPHYCCVVIFDFHDVLVRLYVRGVLREVKKTLKSFSSTARSIASWMKIGWHVLFHKNTNPGKSFEGKIQSFKNDAVYDQYIQYANQQLVDQKMLELLKSLKEQGCLLVLASNIGRDALIDARSKEHLREIFEQFDILVNAEPDECGSYISKPDPRFFEKVKKIICNFMNPVSGQELPPTIFVDDSKKNCDVAREFFHEIVRFDTADLAIPKIRDWVDKHCAVSA